MSIDEQPAKTTRAAVSQNAFIALPSAAGSIGQRYRHHRITELVDQVFREGKPNT